MPDKTIECVDCHQPFVFTEGEQTFFMQKGYVHEPKRCRVCRKGKRSKFPETTRQAEDFGKVWEEKRRSRGSSS